MNIQVTVRPASCSETITTHTTIEQAELHFDKLMACGVSPCGGSTGLYIDGTLIESFCWYPAGDYNEQWEYHC